MSTLEAWWESFYAEGRSRWSGRPNTTLVAEASALPPGRALDIGCGQGADAIWLASQGWTVTAVDVSATALAVAAAHAREAGVADALTWERTDVARSLPAGPFDLVATSYLHSPVEIPRGRILQAAAGAVAPGGTLLVIGHAPSPEHQHADLPTLEEVRADLAPVTVGWEVEASELRAFDHAFAGEAPRRRVDVVVRLRRPEAC
jgi:2-polyprenyl-3-methyl-5-hydroxy-6-metoxy-1,4-benzoquinol methylase